MATTSASTLSPIPMAVLRAACEAVDDSAVWQAPVSRFMAHGILAPRPADTLGSAVQYLTEAKLRP
jgi:hypothetical protein